MTTPLYTRLPLEFFDPREMAKALTIREAAQRFRRSERTIRLWCQDVGRPIAKGPYLIDLPLLWLYAAGERQAVVDYLGGKPLSEVVEDAFTLHGLHDALVDAEKKREARQRPATVT